MGQMVPGTSLWESNTNYWDNAFNWDGTQWQDAFTVGSARIGPASLIEIGNSLTYNPNNVVYQSPEFLSDTSSQIKSI